MISDNGLISVKNIDKRILENIMSEKPLVHNNISAEGIKNVKNLIKYFYQRVIILITLMNLIASADKFHRILWNLLFILIELQLMMSRVST